MACHSCGRIVFLVAILSTSILYVTVYHRLTIPLAKFSLNDKHVVNKSSNQSNLTPGFLFWDIPPENIHSDMRNAEISAFPEMSVDKHGNGARLNVNKTKEQVVTQIRDLQQNITTTHEEILQQTDRNCASTANCSTAFTRTTDVTTRPARRKSFLTLFTTWPYDPKMFTVYNTTVKNWASFYPSVTCIVFTNDSRIEIAVRNTPWEVHKILNHASNGLPVLKHMYIYAMNVFESEFYAYANSDILFTDNLIKTLTSVRYMFSLDPRPIMITGQRWNIVNVSASEVNTKKQIDELVLRKGSLFQPWAADYFITSRSFPWAEMLDIVVGALGLDNWLVIHSRKSKHVVIDATKTILAVHQSLDADMYKSHDRVGSTYNIKLIESVHGWQSFERGKVNCIENVTDIESDRIVIRTRQEMPVYCII